MSDKLGRIHSWTFKHALLGPWSQSAQTTTIHLSHLMDLISHLTYPAGIICRGHLYHQHTFIQFLCGEDFHLQHRDHETILWVFPHTLSRNLWMHWASTPMTISNNGMHMYIIVFTLNFAALGRSALHNAGTSNDPQTNHILSISCLHFFLSFQLQTPVSSTTLHLS